MPEKIVLEQDKNIKTKEVERPVDTPADFTSPGGALSGFNHRD